MRHAWHVRARLKNGDLAAHENKLPDSVGLSAVENILVAQEVFGGVSVRNAESESHEGIGRWF